LEPNNASDTGWFFCAGGESEKEMNDPAGFKILTLSQVLKNEPALRKFMRFPIGTLLRREADRFVEDARKDDQ
jgi:hypothetical protein